MRLVKWQCLEEEWANGMLELKDIITKQFQKTFIQNIILNFCSALIKINPLKILNLKLKF